MSFVYAAAGFTAGFLVGIGATLMYIKWKMGRQLGQMQKQMEEVMDMTGDMESAFGDLDDVAQEKVEDADFEEKEEEEEKS